MFTTLTLLDPTWEERGKCFTPTSDQAQVGAPAKCSPLDR